MGLEVLPLMGIGAGILTRYALKRGVATTIKALMKRGMSRTQAAKHLNKSLPKDFAKRAGTKSPRPNTNKHVRGTRTGEDMGLERHSHRGGMSASKERTMAHKRGQAKLRAKLGKKDAANTLNASARANKKYTESSETHTARLEQLLRAKRHAHARELEPSAESAAGIARVAKQVKGNR